MAHGDIELKKSKAKTANRRLAPLLPSLRAWLEPFRRKSGPVLQGIRDEFDLAKRFRRPRTPWSIAGKAAH